jgi:hypothetical protein
VQKVPQSAVRPKITKTRLQIPNSIVKKRLEAKYTYPGMVEIYMVGTAQDRIFLLLGKNPMNGSVKCHLFHATNVANIYRFLKNPTLEGS